MSKALHPTDLRLREDFCPHTLTLKKEGAQYDRQIFQVGVAAHEILEALGKSAKENPELTKHEAEKIATDICLAITTEGRKYDGKPEGPMTITQAVEGKAIAMRYFNYNLMSTTANYEEPFAFNEDWEPVDYNDPSALFRTIIDVVDIYTEHNDDGEPYKVALVRDYKTSWHIVTEMLDNMQRKAQALSVHLKYPDVDLLKMEVTGLRNYKTISKDIYVHQQIDELKQTKKDLTITIKAANTKSNPSPGLNCMGCPYAHCCTHVFALAKNSSNTIKQYAAHLAAAKALEPAVKAATKEFPTYEGNKLIGYIKKQRVSPVKDATQQLWELWQNNGGELNGFIKMLPMNTTTTKKILTALKKQGANSDEIKETILKESSYSSFGIHKK